MDNMASFLLAVVVISIFIHFLRHIADSRRRHLPPGPWTLPFIGSFHAVAWSAPHRSLARLAERYGPLMSIWVGRFPTVVVSTPDAAREVLRSADLAGRTVLDAWRAEGLAGNSVIFLPPRERWRAMRRFGNTELFARAPLDARQLLRQEKVQGLVRDVAGTALDLLSRTLYSVDIATRELRDCVRAASLLAAKPTVSDVFPAVAGADLQGARRKMGALFRCGYRIIDQQFARRRRDRDVGEPRKNDMMDAAIDKEQEWKEAGSPMDYDAVKGLFLEFFVAGTETASNTVEWAMAELLRRPESMRKVKEELRTVLGTKPAMEESDICKLPYLQAVVKETFRLHPSVSLSFYRAMATTKVQGYTIPKGTNIMLNIWAIHRRADVWPDPNEFMPERFVGSDISYWGKDFELIPFGAGRRICLGLPLAHRIVHLMLGSLLYHFDWTFPAEAKETGGIDMTEKFGIVVSMATPLKAIAKICT